MNFQQKMPEEIINFLVDKIKSKNIPPFNDYTYYAFPQTFASTAGPRNGFGGSAMSTFTIHVYELDNYFTLYSCSGCYILKEESFDFQRLPLLSGWVKI
jgi:hypothetical protein